MYKKKIVQMKSNFLKSTTKFSVMWRENTVENIIDRNDIEKVKSNALNRLFIPWKANWENDV